MKHRTVLRIAAFEEERERLTAIIARQATDLAIARRALRAAVEDCACAGVACDRCRPLLTAAVEIGCW